MTGLLLCLSAAALGVDYGWQPVAGGGIEYIIQIEPALVESLKEGRDLFSDLPSSVSNVRRYRITVGSGRLPHHGEPPPASAVIQASGEMQTRSSDTAKSDRAEEEIDLSQLPGPVLGPAMVLEPPANEDQEQTREPRHLMGSNNETANNRQAAIHESNDPERPASAKVRQDDKVKTAAVEPPGTKAQQTEQPEPSKEVESASDQSPPKVDASLASKSAMTLMGLFFSVACNAVFLFVVADQRIKYRALVRRMFESRGQSLTADYDASLPRWERLPPPEQQGSSGNPGNEPQRTSSG